MSEELTDIIESKPARKKAQNLAVVEAPSLVTVFERLAKDPSVDVQKLRELIDLHRGILEREAQAAFWTAFVEMQPELPTISKDGRILNKNGQVQSRYASNQAIQAAIRPVLKKFGFGLSHRNSEPRLGYTMVTGLLAHTGGHIETDTFTGPADTSGNKNDTQALGSTRAYGARYTTISLLNIITEEEEDGGQAAGRPKGPDGFLDWLDEMSSVADEGLEALQKAWEASKAEYKAFVKTPAYQQRWAAVKDAAQKASTLGKR